MRNTCCTQPSDRLNSPGCVTIKRRPRRQSWVPCQPRRATQAECSHWLTSTARTIAWTAWRLGGFASPDRPTTSFLPASERSQPHDRVCYREHGWGRLRIKLVTRSEYNGLETGEIRDQPPTNAPWEPSLSSFVSVHLQYIEDPGTDEKGLDF